jgi:dTDP-4-amino-4,6-dideoxygalactose transaminase
MKINFNEPVFSEKGIEYINEAIIKNKRLNGDGAFTKKCTEWIENKFLAKKILLTTSCTHALEMAALLCDIKKGDEVIMPSYTFVSTADAFVLRGAKIKFIDIRPDTLNINENLIEPAITERTKAIVPVHYAGVSCEMDIILDIAKKYNLFVVEDAAQGVMSKYKGKYLGTIGDFGSYSFHETKNYTMGEGGAIIINNEEYIKRAEIIREKGTNRAQFFRGSVDKYTWVDLGSSYLPSELNVAYLYAQLEIASDINNERLRIWNIYYERLKELEKKGFINLPYIPNECEHNAHMFYIKVRNLEVRSKLIDFLKQKGILSVFHYVPLHSSIAGKKFGEFVGEDKFTTKESDRLIRLPMYYGLQHEQLEYIIENIFLFFKDFQ